ncbi:heme ABC transporter substrate-binding protein IsdE [Konateibacter massiliensis]|uniref:heme ABC transporter substrate-binding protein IsdE n=1 Tax=Konateibacter massiliensis TaxID=2002841 RepID=UPI001F1A09F6|nr:heme ABC transporter substrate-binding protein IsdE [Konateibacter massiliensis]
MRNKTEKLMKKAGLMILLCSLTMSLGACVSYSDDAVKEANSSAVNEATDQSTDPAIIATSPATAEICAALELSLVGVPHTDAFEIPDVYEGVTEVGTAMAPDMEIVSSLNPEWILSPVSLISDLQPKYEAIDTKYAFLNLSSVTGMYKSIQELGVLFDREEQAEKLVDEFVTFYDEYSAKQEEKESPTVLILMGLPGSYVVATPNSYVGNLVELAGGKNVYSEETQDFINVNTEDMLEKNPDIILRTAHALPESVMEMFGEEFTTNDIWKHFAAVENNRVYDLNYKLFPMSANLQYQEALETLETIFYGDEQGTDGTAQEE